MIIPKSDESCFVETNPIIANRRDKNKYSESMTKIQLTKTCSYSFGYKYKIDKKSNKSYLYNTISYTIGRLKTDLYYPQGAKNFVNLQFDKPQLELILLVIDEVSQKALSLDITNKYYQPLWAMRKTMMQQLSYGINNMNEIHLTLGKDSINIMNNAINNHKKFKVQQQLYDITNKKSSNQSIYVKKQKDKNGNRFIKKIINNFKSLLGVSSKNGDTPIVDSGRDI